MRNKGETELKGMTVNERLFHLGLINQWDEAAKSRNRQKMIEVLLLCSLSQEQSEQTADAVLSNPANYGFKAEPKYRRFISWLRRKKMP